MRFLCLHGKGTNSRIYETQLAAVRYHLGDNHTYVFVEGTLPEPAAPAIKALCSPNEKCFAYFDEESVESCLAALENFERYIEVQGPFDGVIGYSQGGALASTFLVHDARRPQALAPFTVAIFFSSGYTGDVDALSTNMVKQLDDVEVGEVIQIPTAHIWGNGQRGEMEWPSRLRNMCTTSMREEYRHENGHEIPGSSDREAVTGIVKIIRRTIWKAEKGIS